MKKTKRKKITGEEKRKQTKNRKNWRGGRTLEERRRKN